MKIYTKTGDDGTTARVGGDRVSKSHPALDCYGTVDELCASLGLAAAAPGVPAEILEKLREIQAQLFTVGSHLATPPDRLTAAASWLPALHDDVVTRLESDIDRAESRLAPLKNFILPGGCELSARLHLARTVCRRAERLVVSLDPPHPSAPKIIRYLNRLSDWLFVHARLANHLAGIPDIPWHNPATSAGK